MKYCVDCLREAHRELYDIPYCQDHYDERTESDLSRHGRTCRCRACREYRHEMNKWLAMQEGGHLDTDMRPPRNPYVEVDF